MSSVDPPKESSTMQEEIPPEHTEPAKLKEG